MSNLVLGLVVGTAVSVVALSLSLMISVQGRLKSMSKQLAHLEEEIQKLEKLEKSKREQG